MLSIWASPNFCRFGKNKNGSAVDEGNREASVGDLRMILLLRAHTNPFQNDKI